MLYLKLSFLTLSLILSQGTFAHSDEYLDTQTAPHGGQLRMAGIRHYELVVKTNEITVYLTDHAGTKIPSNGATGTATVLSGKSKAAVKLAPAGDNVMKGAGKFGLAPDMNVVVSVAMPGQAADQARFTPLQKSKPEGK
ncbi:MAG: hypothetical protein KJ958_08335 [Gammaproteobacteria bacterium]|nr:hypothetical protein [Gammaproteobacteria bacterium]